MKYYRGKYLIGIYGLLSEGEPLLNICDNVTEFADYLEVKKTNASMILSNLFNKKINYIKLRGKIRYVEFIDKEDLEND